ncbi:hypothetical protein EZJ43_13415 [Pedobacter changchengzhani]|uniref:Uncharacterized protein n=1 Tax=Pedobacter changchengzhani TaxID=2529274 RepID=A0A4V2ZZY9_9SPHI|nr:hypothetical protein [Pedobacter changchengzhani]TDG35613.1 hypothetical protein EZJ43_13415 [Pedobacter changchengzhani]
MVKIEINNDFDTHFFAMEDFELSLKLADAVVKIIYISEPPHGDSYHHLFIDDRKFPGYVWGCHFLFPYHQKYMICSWMKDLYDRKTVIIDIKTSEYKILKKYFGKFKMNNNQIELIGISENEKLTLDLSSVEKLFSVQ